MRLSPFGVVGFLLLSACAFGQADALVVVDMTPEGRALLHPTAAAPALYVPVMRGYKAYGHVRKEDDIPDGHDIVRSVAPELARQGYVATDDAAKAAIVLDFAWGQIGKVKKDAGNEEARDALTMGNTLFDVATPESYGHDQYMQASKEHRFFIVITAFDAAAYTKEKKQVMLWKAKVSMPAAGLDFKGIVPALASAVGPQFGRETTGHPILVANPTVAAGHVDVGTPTEKK